MLVDMNDSLVSEDSSWLGIATIPGVYIEGLILARLGKTILTKTPYLKKV